MAKLFIQDAFCAFFHCCVPRQHLIHYMCLINKAHHVVVQQTEVHHSSHEWHSLELCYAQLCDHTWRP